MADATLAFVLEKLSDLVVYTAKQISGAKDNVKSVSEDLEYFKGFLQEVTKKPIKDDARKALVKQIRNAVFDAEDIVDEYFLEAAKYKASGVFSKIKHPLEHPLKLLSLAERTKPMKAMVDDIYKRNELQDGEGSSKGRESIQAPIVEEDHVVGFEDEVKEYIDFLTKGPDELQVTSIVGMPGLGKTTLANLIFHDPTIEFEFYNRVWVYVSKDCNRKEVFLTILGKITKVDDKIGNMSENDLVEELRKNLREEKYLIVMDDVWSEKDWNSLQTAFPRNNKKSRILITTRHSTVAKHANYPKPKGEPHILRFLTSDESWKLLKMKALGSEECPQKLETHGQHIANECKGLPLAIVVIGGILLEKGTQASDWEDVSQNVKDYIDQDRERTLDNLIAWSFYELPSQLKVCFIYFGMLPKDYHISVRKLVRLWIAEGFIQKKGNMSLEKIAEGYLDDLVKRNLVMVEKWRSNGKMKTSYVHDMIHVFCKNKAAEENSWIEIKQFDDIPNSFSEDAFKTYRGFSVPPHLVNNISPKNFGTNVRSFLCVSSSNEETDLSLTNVTSIPKAFRLLRVFDGEPLCLVRFPVELPKLINLRYLVLNIKFKTIPKNITGLWNVQTLIVKTSSNTLEIKGEINKMVRLRHLETNASTSLSVGPSKKGNNEEDSLRNLRTLSTVSPEICTEDILGRAPNLNKLGIRGQLARLFDENGGRSSLFHNVKKLNLLENLKLVNEVLNTQTKVLSLPDKFPPNIKKLTLTGTQLGWENMSILGKLEKLQILKLKENAFKGEQWPARYGGFPELEVLVIGRTNLATWEASAHHFPNLRSLRLQHCTNLRAVPADLANISSLQIMELYWTTPEAAASAKKQKGQGFKLTIYPPDHDK